MNLENQVVSLELAKRMKELGFEQESLFVWVDTFPCFNDHIRLETKENFKKALDNSILSLEARDLVQIYSAYSVAELGDMMPAKIRIEKDFTDILKFEFTCYKTPYHYSCCYMCEDRLNDKLFVADTEADARAQMLIYLKEKNLL